MFYQQGDVLIKKVSAVKGEKVKGLTLAKGEATGHHHTITEGDAEMYKHEGTLFLKVNSEKATITHQEHKPIVLPEGEYQVVIVQEYNHFTEEAKNVAD